MKKYSQWLKSWRADLDMNQEEFAKHLYVNTKTIQNWESRGTSDTTYILLHIIREQEKKLNKLKP